MQLKIEYLPIENLVPYLNNTRKHEEYDVSQIAKSIEKYGFNDPIGIWMGNVIIEGHGRLLAAKKLGMATVPVIRLDHLNDEERREYAIMHNKTAELSEWDKEMLAFEVGELEFDGFDIDFGLETDEDEPEVIEDDYDESEVPETPTVKLGQIWQLGRHRLMCGDSTKADDVEKLMDGERAGMIFTDPPYNVAIGSKNAFLNSVQPSGRCCKDIANDKGMSDEEIGETLWLPAFTNMRDFSDDCCSIYITMPQGGTHMMMMMMAAVNAGWQIKHEIMWLKNSPTFSMGRLDYDYKHEPIAYGWNKSHVFYGKGEQTKSVWEYNKPKKSNLHPTMKPLELIANALLNSSAEEDIVMDLFGGSGSTLIACEQLYRQCRMMELDPHYCDVIIDRWEKLTGGKAELINV